MKAIVMVSKKSSYGKHRFLTYPVKELTSKTVALDINGTTVDFGFGEVIIVDIACELDNALSIFNDTVSDEDGIEAHRLLTNLRAWKNANGIESTNPE